MLEISEGDDFDLECQLGLLGNEREQERAWNMLYAHYRVSLMSFICKKCVCLNEADAADAVQQTFIMIWNQAKRGVLDMDRPLKGLVFTIAIRRAIDIMRRNRPYAHQDDEVAAAIGDSLTNTKVGEVWKEAQRRDLAREISNEFRAMIPTLPPKQRLVAAIMADFLPDWIGPQEISEEIYRRQGQKIPILEVKGAKQVLTKKFKDLLTKRGMI